MKGVFILTSLMLSAGALILAPSARAGEFDKATRVEFNEPVRVENTVLLPGQYVFKVAGSQVSTDIVQIFSSDDTRLVTTVLGEHAERANPTSKSQFSFYESPQGQEPALRSWYFAGDLDGVSFPETR